MGFRNFPTCHSHPQSLDSASTPQRFAERELELGTGYITATDHGSLAASRAIVALTQQKDEKGNRKYPLTPIIGLEAYFRDEDCPILTAADYPKNANGAWTTASKYHHITIHFKDQFAYETGIRLLSRADARLEDRLKIMEERDRKHGSERKPLFDWADLEELAALNVTMTTGCLIGMVQRHLLDRDDHKTAIAYYERLRGILGPGKLFVEVFPHKCDKNWEEGIFLTLDDGERIKYYAGKKLRTDGGEITAAELVPAFARKDSPHRQLLAVKNRSVWADLPPRRIVSADKVEEYLPNECRPWAPNGDVQEGCNRFMVALARKYGDAVIIGDDSHFATAEEKIIQDIRLTSGGGSWKMYSSYHRQSSDEAYAHFRSTMGIPEATFEGWVENCYAWAENFKGFKLTSSPSLPTKFYPADTLKHTLSLINRHGRMDWDNPVYKARLGYELKLLHKNGVIDLLPYFFVVEEVDRYYEKELKLLTGPGRGSAAGLLLAYCLGITHVDPIKHGLSVDRFITLDRIRSGKLPDIDQDLPNREPLVDPENGWLRRRFGDHYAQVSTDTKLKLRSSVKDVHRALHGYVSPEVEELTKGFENAQQGVSDKDHVFGYKNGDNWEQGSIERDVSLRAYVSKYPKEWGYVQKCLGLSRQKSRHACAYGIANRPIGEFIPLTTVSGVRVTQFTAESVEEAGVVKYDFLGLNSLRDIGDALAMIRERSGVDVADPVYLSGRRVPRIRIVPHEDQLFDIWDLPEDPAVFGDIAAGRSETVFQFNTSGARKWLKHFNFKRPNGKAVVSSIRDLAIFTALDRPGPLDVLVQTGDGNEHNMLIEFARRARGERAAQTLAIINQLLPETHGVMVFQEQLQHVYQQLTGCTGPQAEEFRANVAKKKADKIMKAYGFFMENTTAKIGKENAEEAWRFLNTWAAYGFNLSHAVCYSVVGYACAWLKHHYPLEWWCAVLRNADKNEINENFWHFCGHLIDMPDVSRSSSTFDIQNGRIRAPLNLLHGIGEMAHKQLMAGAPYTSIDDFCEKIHAYKVDNAKSVNGKMRVATSALNRRVVYTLIISGAMDSLFEPGSTTLDQLAAYEGALARATKKKPQAVDERYLNIGPLERYQLRKQILPAYSAPLLPMIRHPDIERTSVRYILHRGSEVLAFAKANQIAEINARRPFPDLTLTVAAVAYVESIRPFAFAGGAKAAVEIVLDIDGGRGKFVKWQRRGALFDHTTIQKGSIILVTLSKFAENKDFAIDTIEIIKDPVAV